jgi:uroporphyrinogen decarboxylase
MTATDLNAVPQPLFLRACRGERTERTPIWIMRQAGRYLPEYRAIRDRYDFLTTCREPDLACEITLQPVRRLAVDAAILFSDILIPVIAMGADVTFSPGPRLASPVRTYAAAEALRVPDPRESMAFVLEAVRLLRAALPAHVPLIGFAGAPLTMAAYLVEGGGSRNLSNLKALCYADPATADLLLDRCAAAVARHLAEQVRAGAQAIMLFDTWAGLLSPSDIDRFARPYARRVFEAVRADLGPQAAAVPFLYYAGDAAGWYDRCPAVGADVIGLDWRADLALARRAFGPGLVMQGNLDPSVLLGPPDVIRAKAAAVLASARQGSGLTEGEAGSIGHVFNLGHGILPDTPPDHAQVLVDTVHELSSRSR